MHNRALQVKSDLPLHRGGHKQARPIWDSWIHLQDPWNLPSEPARIDWAQLFVCNRITSSERDIALCEINRVTTCGVRRAYLRAAFGGASRTSAISVPRHRRAYHRRKDTGLVGACVHARGQNE